MSGLNCVSFTAPFYSYGSSFRARVHFFDWLWIQGQSMLFWIWFQGKGVFFGSGFFPGIVFLSQALGSRTRVYFFLWHCVQSQSTIFSAQGLFRFLLRD